MTAISAAITANPGRTLAVSPRNILVIAAKELRDALSNKWFMLYTASFAVLAATLSFLSLAGAGSYGFASFGRTAAGLLNLIMLIVPLMALTIGAGTIAGERERGMLVYLLAQPVARTEVLLGKFLGLAMALLASLCVGFGLSAALLAWRGGMGAAEPASFAMLVGFTFVLSLAMLSLGMLISACARKAGVAVGVSLFLWLALVFLSDLGLMTGTIVFKLRVEELFMLAAVNPLQAFKLAALNQLNASLDVLGPAGLYASQTFGPRLPLILGGTLLAWVVLPLGLALAVFARRSPL
jgi:Cu-processing system permease protein